MRGLAVVAMACVTALAPLALAQTANDRPAPARKHRPVKRKPKIPAVVDAGTPEPSSAPDATVVAVAPPDFAIDLSPDAGPPDAKLHAAGSPDAEPAGILVPAPAPDPEPEPSPASNVTAAVPGIGLITGRAFAYIRVPITSPIDSPLQQVSSSIWLQAHPRFGEVASAQVTLTVDTLESSLTPDTHLRAQVREAYVDLAKSGWGLRVGQQIIPWGNADVVNPTDFLTAKDFAFFSTDAEVRRIGALSLRGSWTPNGGNSPLELVLVATPVFPASRLLVPPNLLPAGVTNAGYTRPSISLKNAETAARVVYHGDGWDAALVGFRGYNHTPEFLLLTYDAAAGTTTVVQTSRPQLGGGGEASLSAGAWVLRAEGAYVVPTDNPTNKLPTLQSTHVDGVVGIERAFFERLRVQLQGVVRYYPYWAKPEVGLDSALAAIQNAIAQANALLLVYQERVLPASTLRVAYETEDELWSAELFGYLNVRGESVETYDYLVRPMITWHPTDPIKFHLGAEYYGGPLSRPLGSLRPYSGAFVEASYSF